MALISEERKGVFANLACFALGARVLALIDQAAVSGANFATTVLVARFSGAGELAAYSLGTSLILLLVGVQNTLILLPYVIQRRHPLDEPAELAGAALALNNALIGASAALFAVGGSILAFTGGASNLTAISGALAIATPLVLAREFGRRYAFAHLKMAQALTIDIAAASVQLGALGLLGWSGRMSATTATAALGVSCGIAFGGWLYCARRDFVFRSNPFRSAARQSWVLGKWLLAGQMIANVQGYIAYWLSVTILGAAATGVYAACVSVVAFANPLIFGLDNVLAPRLALAFKREEGPGLLREAVQNTALLGAIMAAFSLLIALAGEFVMRILYPGGEFAGQESVLMTLALAAVALALTLPASSALAVMEKPRAIVATGAIALVFTLVLILTLMHDFGLLGIAYGMLAGNAVCALGRWAAFLALVRRRSQFAP